MSVIAKLIRAGIDPELVAEVSEAIEEARAQGALGAGPERTARQDRNARYYQRRKERLNQTRDAPETAPESVLILPPRKIIQPSTPSPSETSSFSDDLFSEVQDSGCERARGATAKPKATSPKKGAPLPAGWTPSADEIAYGRDLQLSDPQIFDAAETMRLWAAAEGINKRDWSATFKNWMRRDAKKSRAPPSYFNGHAAEKRNPVIQAMEELYRDGELS